jgi:HI0933-like protein
MHNPMKGPVEISKVRRHKAKLRWNILALRSCVCERIMSCYAVINYVTKHFPWTLTIAYRTQNTPLSSHHRQGYPRGSKELLGPLSAKFGPWETFEWFSSRGVDLKTEKDGRVFPTTDRSV